MTVKRLLAILFIFVTTSVAWFVLGGSVLARTGESEFAMSQAVVTLWGGRHRQAAPTATFRTSRQAFETVVTEDERGGEFTRRVEKTVVDTVSIPLRSGRVKVGLALEHRRKGLLWHDTYEVVFHGVYRVQAPAEVEGPVHFGFTFPSDQGIYDDFVFRVNGVQAPPATEMAQGIDAATDLLPGQEAEIEIEYRSRGLDTWHYLFSQQGGVATVRDFELDLITDFAGIDFPPDTVAPTEKRRTGDGWELIWRFDNLVSGKAIGLDLPNRLNPGPLTARITFFAPVSLLFFFIVLLMLGVLGHISLHPMHYFFLSTAFFAFHLLLAYLVDHLSINFAFAVAAAVSVALVVSYLRLVCGLRTAVTHAAAAQLIYLVLFSYAFFFEGFAGLTLTVGAVLTLFVLMQLTGRVDWEEAFSRPRSARERLTTSATV